MAITTPTDEELDALERRLQMDWPSIDDAIEAAAALAALRRELDAAHRQVETLREALKEVEAWWLSHGMKTFSGAPYCMFRARAALSETEKK